MKSVYLGGGKICVNGIELFGVEEITVTVPQVGSPMELQKEYSGTAEIKLSEQAKQWVHKIKLSSLAHEAWLRKVAQ